MDLRTFIVRLVEAVAWPAAVVFIFWNLRRQVAALVTRLRRFKWKEAEATFGQDLDKVEDQVAPLPQPISELADRRYLVTETQLPPAYLVQQSWLKLEAALLKVAQERGFVAKDRESLGVLTVRTMQRLELPEIDKSLIDELKRLRNIAVHSIEPNISITDALRYKDLADSLAARIENL